MSGTKVINNPSEALQAVGKENTELHEELRVVYVQLDAFRIALTAISEMPGPQATIALRALAGKNPLNG